MPNKGFDIIVARNVIFRLKWRNYGTKRVNIGLSENRNILVYYNIIYS